MPNASITAEGLATDYPAGTRIEPHAHGAHQIVHAISGVMRVLAREAVWILPPGRGLWVPARTAHEIHCIDAVRMRTVYLGGDHPGFGGRVRVTAVSGLMREIMVRIAEGAGPAQAPHLVALLVGEIAAMKTEPLRLAIPADARIATLAASLREDPADPTPLTGWARRLGFSERSLIRRIRAETGMSFRELRRQARIMAGIERAALGQPVTAIAYDVGFESPSAFIQAFRAVTGTTPGRYMA